ncbi:hypothetical protein LL965_22735 [Xanthomonas cassavae CFBP 4642]|uniref:Uncharacterized protein n=1 Tax=Xanthomonas cassavae CFBP 4642 TaxID=1219375 RepID=A0ABS8HKI7_9XANT|nr:hypothetical protein [Xanthomonas cassavae]MCC4622708.1 hypothetical protein [Xanthomonas cassavae CFBP 4642]
MTGFDRAWLSGPWLRDCGAAFLQTHSYPTEADGGPGINRIMGMLATSLQPEWDSRILFLAQLLMWMPRAPDGNTKNFSLFIRPGDS